MSIWPESPVPEEKLEKEGNFLWKVFAITFYC
jgi:hypothetical protein